MSITGTPTSPPPDDIIWHSLDVAGIAARLLVDVGQELDDADGEHRVAQYGLNEIPQEPLPSAWSIVVQQLSNPMNIRLVIHGRTCVRAEPCGRSGFKPTISKLTVRDPLAIERLRRAVQNVDHPEVEQALSHPTLMPLLDEAGLPDTAMKSGATPRA